MGVVSIEAFPNSVDSTVLRSEGALLSAAEGQLGARQ